MPPRRRHGQPPSRAGPAPPPPLTARRCPTHAQHAVPHTASRWRRNLAVGAAAAAAASRGRAAQQCGRARQARQAAAGARPAAASRAPAVQPQFGAARWHRYTCSLFVAGVLSRGIQERPCSLAAQQAGQASTGRLNPRPYPTATLPSDPRQFLRVMDTFWAAQKQVESRLEPCGHVLGSMPPQHSCQSLAHGCMPVHTAGCRHLPTPPRRPRRRLLCSGREAAAARPSLTWRWLAARWASCWLWPCR